MTSVFKLPFLTIFPLVINSVNTVESPRESYESSNTSTAGSDSVDSCGEKKTKHVTFDKMVIEPKETNPSFRKRKHRERNHSPREPVVDQAEKPTEVPEKIKFDEPVELDDVDLCALLESIPKDVPKVEIKETKEDEEVKEVANRLSAYDNMSFEDKKDFVVQRQNSDDSATRVERTTRPLRVHDVKRNSYDGSNCKMCGLLRKNRSQSTDDVYTLNIN